MRTGVDAGRRDRAVNDSVEVAPFAKALSSRAPSMFTVESKRGTVVDFGWASFARRRWR
jgi:hypothetical protein